MAKLFSFETAQDTLINDLIEEIVEDVHKGDVTAIHELISKLVELDSVQVTVLLEGFLPENNN
jgi:hypothetical protein